MTGFKLFLFEIQMRGPTALDTLTVGPPENPAAAPAHLKQAEQQSH